MFNAFFGLLTAMCLVRYPHNRYPTHQSVYSRFCKWRDDGTLEAVFHAHNADVDLENLSIHSTSTKHRR